MNPCCYQGFLYRPVRFDRHQIDLEKEAPSVETLRSLVADYSETVGSGLKHFLLSELIGTLQVPGK